MTEPYTNGNGHASALAIAAVVTPVAPIPGSIVKGIVKVQAGIAAVAKDGKNPHGGYAFASTDAFYAMLSHKLAEAGLAIICLEDHVPEIVRIEKDGKTSQWARFSFSFVLATEQDTWHDPRSRRSLYIQITGPQTFMAAQSFAEKTYYRSLFKIPTGDKDLDGLPQGETEEEQVALAGIGKTKRKSSAEGKRDGSVKVFNGIDAELQNAQGAIECREIWTKHASELATMPARWYGTLAETYTVKMGEFGVEVEVEDQATFRSQL